MRTLEGLTIGALLMCSLALAQGENLYNGKWHATLTLEGGKSREGTVNITEQVGTWKMTARVYKNPCVGLESPIVIQRATPDELVFKIYRSKALRGCDDDVASVKRINETTLQGELNDGRKLTLVRE